MFKPVDYKNSKEKPKKSSLKSKNTVLVLVGVVIFAVVLISIVVAMSLYQLYKRKKFEKKIEDLEAKSGQE